MKKILKTQKKLKKFQKKWLQIVAPLKKYGIIIMLPRKKQVSKGVKIMKNEWKYLRGTLRITIKAKNESTGKFINISLDIEVDQKIDNYDFIENLEDIIRPVANLRGAYNPEIINIKKL